MVYTIFRLGADDTGGVYQLMKDQLDAHVPPHWMLYIRVENVDKPAAKAVELGGKQIVPPTDIPNIGRFSIIQDPTGAMFSLFQPGKHHGITKFGEVSNLCWADLNSTDPAKAASFYGSLFGWTFETGKDGYRHIVNGTGHENMIGGIPPQMHAPPGTPSHWMSYFHVTDCKASAEKAAQAGARTLMPANTMPDVGTIAVLADPQGAVFALFQPKPRA